MTDLFTLYYTDGCHLCDDASVLLDQLNLNYQKVDIIENNVLIDQYSTLIPVVKNETGATLNWPFSIQQLQEFIEEN